MTVSRTKSFTTPPGFRESRMPVVANGEIVASTFHVRQEIARTETGSVLEAWDMLLERVVALKFAWRDPNAPSLLPESRWCKSVGLRGAVQIFSAGMHHGTEYVACERIQGTALAQQLEPGLSNDDVLRLFRLVAEAVAASHDSGIAVGDLGCETIATHDKRVVLGRLSMSQIPALSAAGRPLAPEVVSGAVNPRDSEHAAAIDLYRLGCTAVELATGHPPFFHSDPTRIAQGHLSGRVPNLVSVRPGLPNEFADLVSELMSKNPDERPTSAQLVADHAEAIYQKMLVSKRPIRVLVVDGDVKRGRQLASLVSRAYPRANVVAAAGGSDAAARLQRERPELCIVSHELEGQMNALEFCMFARGIEDLRSTVIAIVGDNFDTRGQATFLQFAVRDLILRDANYADAISVLVRAVAQTPERRAGRSTISG